jgi:oxygen-independent coproporphyrinogen III oxidase
MRQTLLRYARVETPRYTSYPTAADFHDRMTATDALDMAAGLTPSDALSAYVHVPYCVKLCWYCGCHTSIANRPERVARFAERLDREIDLWADALPTHAGLAHLHFGGGSPNALSPEAFAHIAERIKSRLHARADLQFDVEIDVRGTAPDFIDAMGAAGVRRASLGIQTFDPAVQAAAGRIQPFEMVAEAVSRLRAAGVHGLNLDIMYGLPLQTAHSVVQTVRAAVSLRPQRIAVFGYAHVPWFKKHQTAINAADLPGVEARLDQALAAQEALFAAGYAPVGFDHYALPDDDMAVAARAGRLSRNFQGYTTDGAAALIPLGPSAIGAFPAGFVQNARDMRSWSAAIDAWRLATARGLAPDADDALRAAVISRLLCDMAVDVGEIAVSLGRSPDALADALPALDDLEADGAIARRGWRIAIAPGARFLARTVAACFDARRPVAGTRHATAV